jgi:hypothetical protein
LHQTNNTRGIKIKPTVNQTRLDEKPSPIHFHTTNPVAPVAQVSSARAGVHATVRPAQPCGPRGRLGLLLSLRTLTSAGSLCKKRVPAREMRLVHRPAR